MSRLLGSGEPRPDWLPDRVALEKRIKTGLAAPTASALVARPVLAVENKNHETLYLGEQVRELSLRLDRFAVNQIRALNQATSQLEVVRAAVAAIERRSVETCGIEGMLPGFPAEDRVAVNQIRALNQATSQLEVVRAAVAAIERRSVETCEIEGMLLGFPAEEWRLIAYCRARGAPEPGVLKLFRELVKPGMRVADVGANVGMYTVAAGLAVGPNGRVFAFEPTPRTAQILRENIQLNGLLEQGCVEIRQVAIADSNGAARLGIHFGNCGHNSLFGLDEVDEIVETPMYTLDEAVTDLLDVVKIDAEGADVAVLKGMASHIQGNPAIQIIIELAPELLRKAGSGDSELFQLIEELGLEWLLIADPSGEPVRCAKELLAAHRSANLLLRRGSAL